MHDKALEDARKEQAQARSNVLQKEKKVKKAEKALDAKVRFGFCYTFYTSTIQEKAETSIVGCRNRTS